jgi:hypothetical protein
MWSIQSSTVLSVVLAESRTFSRAVTRESAMVKWLAQPYGKADVDLRRFVHVDFMKIREAADYPTIIDENH